MHVLVVLWYGSTVKQHYLGLFFFDLCIYYCCCDCFFLGWATAELVMTRLLPLWVGARGVEFDWKYIQMSFDANVSLVRVD